VHAVRSVSADADRLARARSATEAFLFRRLESLPETRGRYRAERYFVLRFLAEDVGKEPDAVLDAVLRALSRPRT
jgi:hypothetical protein